MMLKKLLICLACISCVCLVACAVTDMEGSSISVSSEESMLSTSGNRLTYEIQCKDVNGNVYTETVRAISGVSTYYSTLHCDDGSIYYITNGALVKTSGGGILNKDILSVYSDFSITVVEEE